MQEDVPGVREHELELAEAVQRARVLAEAVGEVVGADPLPVDARRVPLLTIAVEGGPKDLASITLVAKFEHDHPGKVISTPAVIVSAATIERQA